MVCLVFDLEFIALGHILPCSLCIQEISSQNRGCVLMECKSEIGVPAITSALLSYKLDPVST